MHTVKIERKDLKLRHKNVSSTISPIPTRQIDNIDFMPIVRLLSRVDLEQKAIALTV